MNNPVIENVINAIVTAINAITATSSGNYTLHAGRIKQVDINNMVSWYLAGGCPYQTGQVLVGQAANKASENAAGNTSTRDQRVFCTCFVSLSDKSDDSPDTAMNRIGADIINKLMENDSIILDETNAQLARIRLDDNPFDMSITAGKGFHTLDIEFTVQYVTQLKDQYVRI
ncbi:MAG: hypothetical protein ABSG22_10580 [Sedimentisphaerales bacterium]|jgi:hypothetical protein